MLREGVSPDPEKIRAVQEIPIPKTDRNVHAFLSLSGYYRKFLPNFSLIEAPLHDLTKKNASFLWTDACHASFLQLKEALASAPILVFPDFHLQFHFYVDASNEGIGMNLGQIQNNREAAIAYGWRKLNSAEHNYSATQREALAVVAAIKHFQSYLYGRPFIIHTDHNALRWLINVKDPTGRLARWSLFLQQYDLKSTIVSVRTMLMQMAFLVGLTAPQLLPYISQACKLPKVYDEQRKDPDLSDIILYLEDQSMLWEHHVGPPLRKIEHYYLDDNGLLRHSSRRLYRALKDLTPTGRGTSGIRFQLVIPGPCVTKFCPSGTMMLRPDTWEPLKLRRSCDCVTTGAACPTTSSIGAALVFTAP